MNINQLHEQMRAKFEVVNGPPHSYFEIPIPNEFRFPNGELSNSVGFVRFIYKIVGVTMRGEAEDVEPILCAWVWQKLITAFEKEDMEDRNVLIFMRRWPQIESYTDHDGRAATKITMRLVIPSRDLKDIFGGALVDESGLLMRL